MGFLKALSLRLSAEIFYFKLKVWKFFTCKEHHFWYSNFLEQEPSKATTSETTTKLTTKITTKLTTTKVIKPTTTVLPTTIFLINGQLPDSLYCLDNTNTNSKIVGGGAAGHNSWKWIVKKRINFFLNEEETVFSQFFSTKLIKML